MIASDRTANRVNLAMGEYRGFGDSTLDSSKYTVGQNQAAHESLFILIDMIKYSYPVIPSEIVAGIEVERLELWNRLLKVPEKFPFVDQYVELKNLTYLFPNSITQSAGIELELIATLTNNLFKKTIDVIPTTTEKQKSISKILSSVNPVITKDQLFVDIADAAGQITRDVIKNTATKIKTFATNPWVIAGTVASIGLLTYLLFFRKESK